MPARAPVTKPWQGQSQDRAARDETSGAKHGPSEDAARFAGRIVSGTIHTPVRVGSAAMPAPFALASAPPFLHSLQAAGPIRAQDCAASTMNQAQRLQRLVAFSGQLVPERKAHGDERLTWFAFVSWSLLSPPP